MQAKVYHGLTNRWVFWTTADINTKRAAEYVANEYAERYGLGDPVGVSSYHNLKQSFAPLDQSGDPRLPANVTGFVEIKWRTHDTPENLEISQQPWPKELWAVRKPQATLPTAERPSVSQEDVLGAVGKASDTLASIGQWATTLAYLGFGGLVIWFIMNAKKPKG